MVVSCCVCCVKDKELSFAEPHSYRFYTMDMLLGGNNNVMAEEVSELEESL